MRCSTTEASARAKLPGGDEAAECGQVWLRTGLLRDEPGCGRVLLSPLSNAGEVTMDIRRGFNHRYPDGDIPLADPVGVLRLWACVQLIS